MPILTRVGRKRPGQIALRIALYAVLTCGAVGILYPLLIVLGQTMSNPYDLRDNAIVPYYLVDRNELALKHVFSFTHKLEYLAGRHNRNQWASQTQMRDDRDFYETRPAAFAAEGLSLEAWQTIVGDLNAFKATIDPDHLIAKAFRVEDYYRPFLARRYGRKADAFLEQRKQKGETPGWFRRTYPEAKEREHILADRDRLGVAILNHEFSSDYLNYHGVEVLPPGNVAVPFWRPEDDPKQKMWRQFKASLPPGQLLIVSSDTYWHVFLKLKYRNVKGLNQAWGTDHAGIYELKLPLAAPKHPKVLRDWREFIVKRWPRRLLRVPDKYAPPWRRYVRSQLLSKAGRGARAEGRALAEAQRLVGRPIRRWRDLPLPATRPADATLSRYWCEFTASGAIPAEDMILEAPELNFRTFLRGRYGSAAALNGAWKASFTSFDEVPLPLALADYAPARFHPGRLRLSFVTESFERVAEYLWGRGRAVQNTAILVGLSLLGALTINPIAAYALSRFPLKNTQKILIFFLATMAFPTEVAMIPNFLLLRDLGLLNTYAALILPRMANGFAIFLLKGFFDSLPQELYEAAELDGASELQVFRMVALPLVLPILAYIGLTTFVVAYSSFMWAFVICPQQEMWTLMVWVYDFQTKNPGNNYIMAATVLVSIPPLLVFLLANKIIMKGIVIPSMK